MYSSRLFVLYVDGFIAIWIVVSLYLKLEFILHNKRKTVNRTHAILLDQYYIDVFDPRIQIRRHSFLATVRVFLATCTYHRFPKLMVWLSDKSPRASTLSPWRAFDVVRSHAWGSKYFSPSLNTSKYMDRGGPFGGVHIFRAGDCVL